MNTPGAHPRIRGEHREFTGLGGSIVGSSPHSRGTLLSMLLYLVVIGLIPAFAGNTRTNSNSANGNQAHPRIRGEHTPSRLAIC